MIFWRGYLIRLVSGVFGLCEWRVLCPCALGLILLLSASHDAVATPSTTQASWKKTAGEVTANGDGTYTASITLEAINTGNETLVQLQFEDNLDIFGTGQLVLVSTPAVLAGNLTLNPDYDGLANTQLLTGSDSLDPGAKASLRFEITFDPATESGPFRNRAKLWTKGAASGETLDIYATASIGISPPPTVRWKKLVGEVLANGDGTYTAPIILNAKNNGDETLINLQFKDDLDIFGSGQLVAVSTPTVLSGKLAINPNYDGLADTRLLTGRDSLKPGARARLQFDITFNPGTEAGPFRNQAKLWTKGMDSGVVFDLDAKANIVIPLQPAASWEKSVGIVVANGDGTYTAPITLEAINTGDEVLIDLQFKDDLDIFGSGQLVAVGTPEVLAGGLTLNPGYDGLGDINLLAGSDSLETGTTASLRFEIAFDPGTETGPFNNQALIWTEGKNSGEVLDFYASADITVPVQPAASWEKSVGQVVANGDGTYTAPITLAAVNTGRESLAQVQFKDDLDIFGSGQLISVSPPQIRNGTLTLNPDFDGLSDIRLLDGSDVLAPSEDASLSFAVTFDPGDEPGPFTNLAVIRSKGEDSGNILEIDDDAIIRLPPIPGIMLDKIAGAVTANGDGSLSVPITLVATNSGTELLNGLQLEDHLDIFRSGQLIAIEDLAAPGLTLNPDYDGQTDTLLLDGSAPLPIGSNVSITFTLRFDPGGESEPFLNTAIATATGDTSGTGVSDRSEASFVATASKTDVSWAKTAGKVVANGDGTFTVPITLAATNTGNETLIELQFEDDLDIFGAGQVVSVSPPQVLSGSLTLNPNFDGLSDIRLLDGSDTLAPAEEASLGFDLTFDPGAEPGPFTNVAFISASGNESGTNLDFADQAVIRLPPRPAIVLDMVVGAVTSNDDGSLSVPISLTGTNGGDELLNRLQLEIDLDIFGSGQLIAIEGIVAAGLTLNPGFDGLMDTLLLDGSDTLPVANSASVSFTLRFNPGDESESFQITAAVTATGDVSGTDVSDRSEASFERPGPSPLGPAGIFVTKSADRTQVMRGDTFGYVLSVTNLTTTTIRDIVISDNPPAGFRFVDGTAMLIRAGPDGSFDSADDLILPIAASGINLIVFDVFDLAPNERVQVRFLMRVSIGVVDGDYVNNVSVAGFGRKLFSTSAAPVTVVGDPVFEKTTLIGKVFDDQNENALHDGLERGIPGVRLATVDGLTVETDANGRYHIADVDVDRFERGANFIIKLDMATLPQRSKMISENPRVIRLTQATLSKVNFAVKLPDTVIAECYESCLVEDQPIMHRRLGAEMCVDALPLDPEWPNGPLTTSIIDPSMTRCTSPHTGPLHNAVAREITVSGGLFGCGTLVASTLPGRAAANDSKVTVFGSKKGTDLPLDHVCYVSAESGNTIRAGRYPIELKTQANTALVITGAGDVVRLRDPNNDEHIIVTPFRDDTDNTVISALRVINDGMGPSLQAADIDSTGGVARQIKSATVDALVADPRLDVLALNRAVFDMDGNLAAPIKFGIYTNYSSFIDRYKLEIYGKVGNVLEKKPFYEEEFSEYRFDRPREFAGINLKKGRFTELEYRLIASSCRSAPDDNRCFDDITSARILNLHGRGDASEVHPDSELWGQTNLVSQRIPIRGSRVRISDSVDPTIIDTKVNGSYVPVGKNNLLVLEEHLPSGDYKFSRGDGRNIGGQAGRIVTADAHNIEVSGGLFGCGQVVADVLLGRQKNSGDAVHALTVAAVPDADAAAVQACPPGQRAANCHIEILSKEGSRICVTAAGDISSEEHPPAGMNQQKLVVTPFRDYTDSTIVSALRIANEGSPRQIQQDLTGLATPVSVNDDYWFAVGFASLTVGENDASGNVSLLSADDHFDGSTYADGRLAFYAKGKLSGKYRITAQLDSTEDELKNLGDNLKRKDPRRIFRQLDPNLYYPVYGDDSTVTSDVDTRGAFYARVDWDKNLALWGNFNTGLTDTEFMQYNRSLYGTKITHEASEATKFGNSKTKLTVFGSEAQSVAAHVTFRATGGSLYYLRDTDIVQGSEKVWIEVRRRDTEQVVERMVLIEGRDYEIDAIQGRIILRRPLSQVVNDRERSIIRSSPLEGDEVFLLADYEYVPASFVADDLTYGGRGQAWLGDHVAIGATAITDERNGTDYTLRGGDLILQHSENSYLRAEYAQSRARQQGANFISSDGGLTFQSQTDGGTGSGLHGDVTALEGNLDLADISDSLDGDLHAWSKNRGAEFSTGRLAQGVGVDDNGVEMHLKIGDDYEVTAAHTDLEREQLSRERVTRLQVSGKLGDLDAGLEVRHEDVDIQAATTPVSDLNGANVDGEALLLGARLGYGFGENSTIYAVGQKVAYDQGTYKKNDLFALGINTKPRENLGVSLEASDGDRGSALIAGVDYAVADGLNFNLSGGVGSGAISQFATRYAIGEGHELYGSYAVDQDRSDSARNLLTLGQRRVFGRGLGLFAESQFGKDDRYASVAHVFGLEFEGEDDWRFNASVQFSENEGLGLAFERRALSFGAFRNKDDLKFSSRIEFREDEGASVHQRQYVSSNSATLKLDEDNRLLGGLNISWTDDELNGGHDARFVEFDIGHAYRPTGNETFNVIARYSFLYDLPTEGQATIRPDERSHLLSIEGIHDPENRWEFAAKLAIRKGEQRVLRDTGPWQDFGLRLASVRARYQVNRKWDGLAEYRWLSDHDGDNDRQGVLLAAYRQVNDYFKVGVGFNFTEFNDQLRIDSYDNRGWFVDIIGMY